MNNHLKEDPIHSKLVFFKVFTQTNLLDPYATIFTKNEQH